MTNDTPDDQDLTSIAKLTDLLLHQEQQVAEATAILQERIRAYRMTVDQLLPEAMLATGLAEFTTAAGTTVKIDSQFHGSKVTNPEALKWLEEHGAGDLIKSTIRVDFPVTLLPAARELLQQLREHPSANQFTSLTLDTSVHPSTIAAYVKELDQAGETAPLDTLGVHQKVSAKVGEPRYRNVKLTGLIQKDPS